MAERRDRQLFFESYLNTNLFNGEHAGDYRSSCVGLNAPRGGGRSGVWKHTETREGVSASKARGKSSVVYVGLEYKLSKRIFEFNSTATGACVIGGLSTRKGGRGRRSFQRTFRYFTPETRFWGNSRHTQHTSSTHACKTGRHTLTQKDTRLTLTHTLFLSSAASCTRVLNLTAWPSRKMSWQARRMPACLLPRGTNVPVLVLPTALQTEVARDSDTGIPKDLSLSLCLSGDRHPEKASDLAYVCVCASACIFASACASVHREGQALSIQIQIQATNFLLSASPRSRPCTSPSRSAWLLEISPLPLTPTCLRIEYQKCCWRSSKLRTEM